MTNCEIRIIIITTTTTTTTIIIIIIIRVINTEEKVLNIDNSYNIQIIAIAYNEYFLSVFEQKFNNNNNNNNVNDISKMGVNFLNSRKLGSFSSTVLHG